MTASIAERVTFMGDPPPPGSPLAEVWMKGAHILMHEAVDAISEGMPKWRDADSDPPADEQKVLGCWVGPSVVNEGMESLTYHAADAPDSHERWYDAFGMERDPPTHWMPRPETPK